MRRAGPIVVLLAGFAAGCFEPPVLEVLLLRFTEEGGATATLEVHLADPDRFESAAERRRVAERERALLEGTDPWLDRFAAVAADSDSLSWRRRDGELRSFERAVETAGPEALAPLFEGDGAGWLYERDGTRATLEIVPQRAGRASRRDRERVLREIASWSEAYAGYVAAARALDRRTTGEPAFAAAAWHAAFGDEAEDGDPLPVEERRLAAELHGRMTALLELFKPDPRDGRSLDERVREAFHPFAAQVGIELPCEADEAAGFAAADPGDYLVPELALRQAAVALEGRWLRADPLAAVIASLADEAAVAVEPFVEAPLATDLPAPSARDVDAALRAALSPPEVYRLAWSCIAEPPGEEPE